jgi:hypothetical protein
MNAEQWAAHLNGNEYREELDDEEQSQAKADGVLIVFGASDDLIEFRGIILDEVGCYDGGEMLIADGKVERYDDHFYCPCKHCGYSAFVSNAKRIEARWSEHGYSWFLRTHLPHATFDILEEGEKYCRGIVIDGKHL